MKKRNKRIVMVLALILCMNVLVACGAQETENQPESTGTYYNIETTQKEMGTPSQTDGRWQLLNAQFYQGEAVQIWYARKETAEGEGLLDVYLYREDGSTELLVSGISEEYLGTWFLDGNRNIYIISGRKITRMTADGTVLYTRTADSAIEDVCQLADGTIMLMVQTDAGETKLAVLDSESGKVTEKVTTKWEESGIQYLSANGEGLVLLDKDGLWSVNVADGSRESLFDFAKTSYQMNIGLLDFCMVDEKNVELLYYGKVESLAIGEVGQEKEIIVLRDSYVDYKMEDYINQFNQQSEKYFIQIEECATELNSSGAPVFLGLSDFRTQTNMEIVNGEGADILGSDAIGDVRSYIEKGIIEDLKPYMDAAGMKEEDYFPAAFGSRREGDKIYGIHIEVNYTGLCMDMSLLGEDEEPDIETVVDALLSAPKETILRENYTPSLVLKYFLAGSESLWGMVDWEKGTCNFQSGLFAKMLEAAKLRGYDEKYSYSALADIIRDGTFFTFETEEDLAAEGQVKVGYFFDDGYHPAIALANIWVINSNSSKKEGAWEFFRFLLSEEFQASLEDAYPVNRKAFEKVAEKAMEDGPIQAIPGGISYKAGVEAYITYGKEEYIARFGLTPEKLDEIRSVVEDARPLPSHTEPILDIILEEAAHYFNGMKTIEEIIPIIENRVQLYLEEHA